MSMVLLLGLALVLVNGWVTLSISRSNLYESRQKQLQYLLVWLTPVIGAVIAWAVLRAHSASFTKNEDDITGNSYLHWNYSDANEGHPHDYGQDAGH